MQKNPLMDEEFLKKLHEDNAREVYACITALTIDELPIEQIQGQVCDGGNITIDGKSAVRRTCNLTLTAENVNINEFYWGIKTKIKVEIGLKNYIEPKYPDIIWFPQGIFVLTSFSTTQTTNKWTIKITGKDKMCLLNGDLAGHLPHETDFGKEEYHDLETDTVTYTEVPIKNIIRNAVQEFGGELPQNIIINDLDDLGLELVEYRSTTPMYLYKEANSQEYQSTAPGSTPCRYTLPKELSIENYNLIPLDNELRKKYQLNDSGMYGYIDSDESRINYQGTIEDEFAIRYDNLQTELDTIQIKPTEVLFKNDDVTKYTIVKFAAGDMPGYFVTELTYAGDLIAKVGETITSVLDKIKNMLVNFEYYYDINGKFIFQKKKEYITMSWNNTDTNDTIHYLNTSITNRAFMYSFIDGKLVTSFQNTPKINEIKNDYSIWGSYNNNGKEIPIHLRYAIDKKPTSYLPVRPLKEEIQVITKDASGAIIDVTTTYKYYDAPEIEPYNNNCLIKKEPTVTEGTEFIDNLSPSITTIMDENNYTHITKRSLYFAKYPYSVEKTEYHDPVDWRELIYQMALDYRKCHHKDDFPYWIAQANPQFPSGRTHYEQYYIDFEGFWRTLYDPNPSLNYSKINANEVINYTTLLDNNQENDLYDNIYIKNGLRPIKFNDYYEKELNANDLFLFDEDGLRKWKCSEWCHLELNYPYFIRENKEMTMYRAEYYIDDDVAYKTLNSVAIDSVYKKVSEQFQVEVAGQGPSNLIDSDELKFHVFSHFKNTDYGLEALDYQDVVADSFSAYLSDWSNLNTCYVKDKEYVKLTESDFFDYYYYSYYLVFITLAARCRDMFLAEVNDKFDAMVKYNSILTDFENNIINYNAKDLKVSFDSMKLSLIAGLKGSIRLLKNVHHMHNANGEYSYTMVILQEIYEELAKLEGNSPKTFKDVFNQIQQSIANLKINYDFAQKVTQIRVTETDFIEKREDVYNQMAALIKDYKDKSQIHQLEIFVNQGLIDDIIKMEKEEYDAKIYAPCAILVDFVKQNTIINSLFKEYGSISGYFSALYTLLFSLDDYITHPDDSRFAILKIWLHNGGIDMLPELSDLVAKEDFQGLIDYWNNTKLFHDKYYYTKYNNFYVATTEKEESNVEYYWGSSSYNRNAAYGNFWNTEIDAHPQKLLFWIDFLEPASTLMEKISVPVIGSRTKVVDDKNVKAVHYKDIPNVIFKRNNDKSETERKSGYTYVNINKATENYFSISSKGKSANERLEELLYTNGYCPENITVQAIPVYHLEPNHHIYIQDKKSGIDGEYMVEKITIPLSYNKTMSITASKVVDSIN